MTFEGLPISEITGTGILVLVAILVITRKMVWHTDLDKAEERTKRWEDIALSALGVADKMTVHAEVTNKVLKHLPDPAKDESP